MAGGHPGSPGARAGRSSSTCRCRDKAFNTSGDYERFVLKDGVRYHHILDARTGFPVASYAVRSTILAGDAFTADTLDTAVCLMGAKAGMKLVEELDRCRGGDHRSQESGARLFGV